MRKKILAVDDDPANLDILTEVFDARHDLVTASSGPEALALASQWAPDLVLLDIMMPGMDGCETCRRLRELPGMRHAKVILVSAKAMLSERMDGYRAGADDYVTKPFDDDELVAKVDVFLRLQSEEMISRLKGDLLDLVAHEIRTPLTGILPAAEFLMDPAEMAADDRRTWARMIWENGCRLSALAEQGMLLCRLRSERRATIDISAVDVAEVLDATVAGLAEFARARDVELAASNLESMVVLGDPTLLRAMFDSLIRSAIASDPATARVDVAVQWDGDRLGFAVRTDGAEPGSRAGGEEFDVFAPRRVAGQVVGAGIELALVREIVALHRGEVEVDERREPARVVRGWLPA